LNNFRYLIFFKRVLACLAKTLIASLVIFIELPAFGLPATKKINLSKRSPYRAVTDSLSLLVTKISENYEFFESRKLSLSTSGRFSLGLIGAVGLHGRVNFLGSNQLPKGKILRFGGDIWSRRGDKAPFSLTIVLGKNNGPTRGWFSLPTRHGMPIFYSLKLENNRAAQLLRVPATALSHLRCPVHGTLVSNKLAKSYFVDDNYQSSKSKQPKDEYSKSALATLNSSEHSFKEIEISTDTDAEFANKYANIAQATSISYVNAIDVIYQSELQSITVTNRQRITVDSEIYPPTMTSAEDLHDRFTSRDLGTADVHILLSGKDFDGGTVGLAWVGGACNSKLNYGIVQDINSAITPVILAHELAHLLSAQHDEDVGCDSSSIMSKILRRVPPTRFSSCTKSAVMQFFSKASCFASVSLDDKDDRLPLAPAISFTGRLSPRAGFRGRIAIDSLSPSCEIVLRTSNFPGRTSTGKVLYRFVPIKKINILSVKPQSRIIASSSKRNTGRYISASFECTNFQSSVSPEEVFINPAKVIAKKIDSPRVWWNNFVNNLLIS
jgi:hypothetical protein